MAMKAIVFDPAYDAYDPAIRLAGGRCIHIPARAPGLSATTGTSAGRPSTSKTRLIVINNPHNPACTVAERRPTLDALAILTRDRPISVIADEVYEHVQYDGRVHQSVMKHAELRHRSFAVYSFGQELHITGWRVG
jgi:methionine aminotransferase